jgi:hypothetical protein
LDASKGRLEAHAILIIATMTLVRSIEIQISDRRTYAVELSQALPPGLEDKIKDVLLCEAIGPDADHYTVSKLEIKSIRRANSSRSCGELLEYIMSFRSFAGMAIFEGIGIKESLVILQRESVLDYILSAAASLQSSDFCKRRDRQCSDQNIDEYIQVISSNLASMDQYSIMKSVQSFAATLCGVRSEGVRSIVAAAAQRTVP